MILFTHSILFYAIYFLFLKQYLNFLECHRNLVRAGYKSDDCGQKKVVSLKPDNQRLPQREAMEKAPRKKNNQGHKGGDQNFN